MNFIKKLFRVFFKKEELVYVAPTFTKIDEQSIDNYCYAEGNSWCYASESK